MTKNRSFRFTHFLCRTPSASVTDGLRAGEGPNPDAGSFAAEHEAYVETLRRIGGEVTVLPADERFPDSVFIEDPALIADGKAIVLRPGAASRLGEAEALRPSLLSSFGEVVDLPGDGFVDGGDVLLTDEEAFIGRSARTDQAGFDALAGVLRKLGYEPRRVDTPPEILHFKTECGLLDGETIFATKALAATGCFDGYKVIHAPEGEEAAANLIRINEHVLMRAGFPKTEALLRAEGFAVETISVEEAPKVDGGLSCMSLRFSLGA
ncbi:MAG: arginine deiminase-related protein [Pseudomonadota bacterium]